MKALITAVVALTLLAAPACSFPEPTRPTATSSGALPPPEDATEPAPEAAGESGASPAKIDDFRWQTHCRGMVQLHIAA